MTPAQLEIQLAAINRIIEGTGTVIDIKLPTEPQKTRGRPRGATNKPKTTRRDMSAFEHVEKKCKNEDKEVWKAKKVKTDQMKAAKKKNR